MNTFFDNIMNKAVNLYNSFSSKPKPETGDGLPDEVTIMVLAKLSSSDRMKSCEQVCRKWNRITNQARFWENLATRFNISFNFKPDQPITLEIKKQISTCLKGCVSSQEECVSSQEELEKYLEKIYHSVDLDNGQLLALYYKSDSHPNAVLKIFITKPTSPDGYIPAELPLQEEQLMKQVNYFYLITGKSQADFAQQTEKKMDRILADKGVETVLARRETKNLEIEVYGLHYSFSLSLFRYQDVSSFIDLIANKFREADRRKEG